MGLLLAILAVYAIVPRRNNHTFHGVVSRVGAPVGRPRGGAPCRLTDA
jgi:hypothetical protein